MEYILLIGGLAALVAGGEFLVKGAVGMAIRLKISMLVIGLTVVSFATSAPELLVSIQAAMKGIPNIAFGNVIGSNIANIALVLGVTAIIFPIRVSERVYKLDWVLMMLASIILYFFMYWGNDVNRIEGVLLFSLLVALMVYTIKKSRKEAVSEVLDKELQEWMPYYKVIGFMLLGVVCLYFGSEWLIKGAVSIAKDFGISDRVISITVVAFGTSVPELATSVMAAIKGREDLSVGNLVGSNIFNILAVLGITASIKTMTIENDALLNFDMLWMIGIAFLLLPLILLFKARAIGRLEGFILIAVYVIYIYSVF